MYAGQGFQTGVLFRGAWISVYAGASLSLWIVEAGITIEARLLESYFIPELAHQDQHVAAKGVYRAKAANDSTRIRVWLWYRFRLCIRIKCKLFGCSIKIKWCSEKTLASGGGQQKRSTGRCLVTVNKMWIAVLLSLAMQHALQDKPQTRSILSNGMDFTRIPKSTATRSEWDPFRDLA
ncbi:hypothetical protein OS493_032215 [Desmophyllum pertusum]|uniref:Uncharacterized protein n=1 Tax=Desmophyllum pertusum TaxID=174260 RepID=A0A9W9ZWW1_9CNID|nr:hypothetical protein OS493_032215 [Desmophyllum pertusum]